MEFRKTVKADVPKVMEIINQAKNYLKGQGIDQWQKGYPNEELIYDDIEKGIGYVMVKDGEVIATTAISFEEESAYNKIQEGKWITEGEYSSIHRIAVANSQKGSGVMGEMVKCVQQMSLERGMHSIKIDTHEENLSMQKAMENSGFKYCGVIYLEGGPEDGDKRVAYEKVF